MLRYTRAIHTFEPLHVVFRWLTKALTKSTIRDKGRLSHIFCEVDIRLSVTSTLKPHPWLKTDSVIQA